MGVPLLEKIRERRGSLGLTQSSLSERAGVSLATLQNLECGKGNPELKTLENIFGVLGLELVLKPKQQDMSRWSAFGLPIMAASERMSFRPSRERLLSELKLVGLGDLDVMEPRTKRAWVEFLRAIRDHYPSLHRQLPRLSDWLRENEKKFFSPKLRRISLEVLSTYL